MNATHNQKAKGRNKASDGQRWPVILVLSPKKSLSYSYQAALVSEASFGAEDVLHSHTFSSFL